jgi:hypothetical protein
MTTQKLTDCPDCGAKPGQVHNDNCDVERCSVCGGQKLMDDCEGHDKAFARWTGLWPGVAEAAYLGLYSKMTKHGWMPCPGDDPQASADLNKFYDLDLHKIFFVEPMS